MSAFKSSGNSSSSSIVIIGLGTIGKTILKNLAYEGHNVTIIDEDKEKVESLIEKYDVTGVVGNGASMDIQKEANTEGADLTIALTRNDELNIFACLVAKRLGVKHTIARVRNPEYDEQSFKMRDIFGPEGYYLELQDQNLPEDAPARILYNWIISQQGKELLEKEKPDSRGRHKKSHPLE